MANITLKTVQKRIRTATSTTETMRKDVQSALLGLVEHVSVHGDKNVVLTNAPEWIKSSLGINRKAMVDYLVQFAGANFKEAKATEWWTLKVDQPFAGFDLSIELAKLIKKAESAKDKSDNGDDVVKSKIKVDQNTLNKLHKVA